MSRDRVTILREIACAMLLLIAGASMVVGVAMISPAVGWIAVGVVLVAWVFLVFGDFR